MVYTEPVCMSIVFDILKLKNRPLIICDLLFSIKNFKKSTWDSIMLHLCMYKTRLGAPKPLQMLTADMKLKDGYSLEEMLWST